MVPLRIIKDPTICVVRIMTPRGNKVAKTVRVMLRGPGGQSCTKLSIAGGTLLLTNC